MNARWKEDVCMIADELQKARAVAIFGLCGVSLEDQHCAFSLARRLSAYVSVERPLLPTLTRGSFGRHTQFLIAGGEPNFLLPQSATILRDDRLLAADAWRKLRILQRGRTAEGTEAYEGLYSSIVASSGAAFLPSIDHIDDSLRRETLAFRNECALPLGLDILQTPKQTNLQGAYETALEEAGGAHASFSGGEEKADDALALPELLRQRAIDAVLLIGESVLEPKQIIDTGIPLYVLGHAAADAKICIPTARLGETDGGTILREDGIPLSIQARSTTELPKMGDVLEMLLAEVCTE
jgi:hypothetical protein